MVDSFLTKFNTMTVSFEPNFFHNNLKDKAYGQVYTYEHCTLLLE